MRREDVTLLMLMYFNLSRLEADQQGEQKAGFSLDQEKDKDMSINRTEVCQVKWIGVFVNPSRVIQRSQFIFNCIL